MRDGKGIFYFSNGDREMGDYLNDKKVGKHLIQYSNGTFKEIVYPIPNNS